jgi:hypothetical protein
MNRFKGFEHIKENKTANIMNKYHSHAEIENDKDPDGIVYSEGAVILMLTELGFEPPVWSGENPESYKNIVAKENWSEDYTKHLK